jgi:hypothetical protein
MLRTSFLFRETLSLDGDILSNSFSERHPTMNVALHPVPEVEKFDTGLRYTDILFGFVIRELFLRLQNWAHIDGATRWHLVVGATLVLGSWIGFRRSLYRSGYQLKFFNLPLFRFLVDQLMLILYFRIAVLVAVDAPVGSLDPVNLARSTVTLVLYVFILYLAWDVLGIWMVKATIEVDDQVKPRYPVVNEKEGSMTDKRQTINWKGILITAVCLLALGVLWKFNDRLAPFQVFGATILLLLVYRWLKEIRTSCRLLQQA